MTELHDFSSDPKWISKRLGHMVTEEEVTSLINTLLELGLLKKENNKLTKTHARLSCANEGTFSKMVRLYHEQAITYARDCLWKQEPNERIFNSSTMTIDTKKLPEALNLVHEFRSNMERLLEKKNGDDTYQLNIQFVRITVPQT